MILENIHSKVMTENCEDSDAEDSHIKAVTNGEQHIFLNSGLVPDRLLFRDRRQEYDCQRIYDGRGKHDEGHGHTGKDAVNAACL